MSLLRSISSQQPTESKCEYSIQPWRESDGSTDFDRDFSDTVSIYSHAEGMHLPYGKNNLKRASNSVVIDNLSFRFIDRHWAGFYAGIQIAINQKFLGYECSDHLPHTCVSHILYIKPLKQIITLSPDKLKIWHHENENISLELTHPIVSKNREDYFSVHISPDHRLIVARTQNNKLYLFDLFTYQEMMVPIDKEYQASQLTVISSSQIVFFDPKRQLFETFDINLGQPKERTECLHTMKERPFRIEPYAFLSNGDIIFISNSHSPINLININIYHCSTQKISTVYKVDTLQNVNKITISSDEKRLRLAGINEDGESVTLMFAIQKSPAQEKLNQLLADSLPQFSLNVVKVVAGYCGALHSYRLDPRMMTSLPYGTRLMLWKESETIQAESKKAPGDKLKQIKYNAQVYLQCILVNPLAFLSQGATSHADCVAEVTKKYPECRQGAFSRTKSLFKTISESKSIEERCTTAATPKL